MVLEIDDHEWRSSGPELSQVASSPGFVAAQDELQIPVMSNFMSHVAVPVAIGAVAVVLLLGLANMMRGGSPNTSQKLMRMRVLLQFIAIVVIMLAVWVMHR
jgi:hypothetical protein